MERLNRSASTVLPVSPDGSEHSGNALVDFLKGARIQVHFQVDPDIEARATAKKRDPQSLQLLSDVSASSLQPRAVSGL